MIYFLSPDTHSQESTESSTENSDSHTNQSDNGSHRNTTTTSTHSSTTNSSSCPTNAQVAAHLLSPSQVTLSNLPKLISQLAGTKGLPNLSELSPQEGKKHAEKKMLIHIILMSYIGVECSSFTPKLFQWHWNRSNLLNVCVVAVCQSDYLKIF